MADWELDPAGAAVNGRSLVRFDPPTTNNLVAGGLASLVASNALLLIRSESENQLGPVVLLCVHVALGDRIGVHQLALEYQ